MSLQRFTSEAYSGRDRTLAWQDVLGAFGLRSVAGAPQDRLHATATLRGEPDGVLAARLTAGEHTLMPLAQKADWPLLLRLAEDGSVLHADGARLPVPAGALVLLPRRGAWELAMPRGLQAVCLSVRASAFRGRQAAIIDPGPAGILPPSGLALVLAGMLHAIGAGLDVLSAADWAAIETSLAELFLTLVSQRAPAAKGTATQAALLHRVCQTIERRLDDPDLTPSRVAQTEGISERYLQKLFEGIGDSFSHYLRERRLQRTAAALCSPAEASLSVTEIAFRCGFNDPAHFSRTFRERFGRSPRDFRQQEAERRQTTARPRGQRGWPESALNVRRRSQAEPPTPGATHQPCQPAAIGPSVHHHLPVDASRVHWGFFSRALKPQIEIASGDTITVETLTQHASDDPERMIAGDPGAESVFRWTPTEKGVDRRGAGPIDGSIYGRGAGEGFGVHICTGPIAVKDAQPGDVLEVRILDLVPRPSRNPEFAGRAFGSSVAAWWGYHYAAFLSEPKPREVVTIYEIDPAADEPHARAVYSYRWAPQTDPFGVVHRTYDYPGVPVAPGSVDRRLGVLDGVRIPLRPHLGVIGVAPREADLVDSVPPSYFGGNIDNWRLGKGAAVYLPVSVPGALLSVGDPHAAQGDGELGGTAVECSMTATLAVILHKKADLGEGPLADLTYPLIETATDWVLTGFSHPNHLAEFGAKGQSEVYAKSSLDLAMKDAFHKTRRFLMSAQGMTEDEAIALISAAVDFGITQVVDGNWGVHAVLSKRMFPNPPW
jgi:acetamidase/formamidase/AraC-like DNA-binding protein